MFQTASNICALVRIMPGVEARNTRGIVFKTGKIDFFRLEFSGVGSALFPVLKKIIGERE